MKKTLTLSVVLFSLFIVTEHFRSKAQIPIIVSGNGGGGAGQSLISSNTLGSAVTTITFTGIPGVYKNLYLTLIGRGDTAAVTINANVTFNADSGTNYAYDLFASNGNVSNSGQTSLPLCSLPAATNTASYPGECILWLPGYAQTFFNKTVIGIEGNRLSVAPTFYLQIPHGEWANTAAITTITFTASAGNFVIGTTATLWGQA